MNKKGVTLMELLFVMTLLAVVAIVTYPYVLDAYKQSQKDTFLTEAKNLHRRASDKYGSELVKNNRLSRITDSDNSRVDVNNDNLKYCINLTYDGDITDIKVTNGIYYVEGKEDFLDITTVENLKYGKFDNFSCDYVLNEADLLEEVSLEDLKNSENYKKMLKIIFSSFGVVVVLSFFVNKNRR